jgi:hypothetical protein
MVSIKWGLPGLLLAVHLFASAYAGERDSILKEARSYELTEKGARFRTTTTVTVFPRKDGRFNIDASCLNNHEKDWTGIGSLEKDGWIHFSWEDNFLRKGEGAIQLLDHGAKVDFCPYGRAGASPQILPWTGEPVMANARTRPTGYSIHLPGSYTYRNLKSSIDITVELKPQKNEKVNISIDIAMDTNGDDMTMLEGTAVWKQGDILEFFARDFDSSDPAKGQLHFSSPNNAIMTITSYTTTNSRKKAVIRRFNAAQIHLRRDSESDSRPHLVWSKPADYRQVDRQYHRLDGSHIGPAGYSFPGEPRT